MEKFLLSYPVVEHTHAEEHDRGGTCYGCRG